MMSKIKRFSARISVLVFLAAMTTACPPKKEPQDNTALFLLLAAANACSKPSAAPAGCSAACSKDTTAALGTRVGSCNVASLGMCREYGTGWTAVAAQSDCSGVSGTWATTSCPATNAIATMVTTENATGKTGAMHFYSSVWTTATVVSTFTTSAGYTCNGYSEP